MVFIIFRVTRHSSAQAHEPLESGAALGRTATGRLTRSTPGSVRELSVIAYFLVALAVITGGCFITVSVTSNAWILGYVIYGLFAIFCVLVPYVLAFWFASDVPFPTLARTIGDLQRRWRPATMVIVAGLIVLMLHLAFAPWPDIFSHGGPPP